jgi:hypothetical protein
MGKQTGGPTDYATELAQPVHQPGMEGVVNRGSGRPQVGPADDATRNRLLKAALSSNTGTPGGNSAPSPTAPTGPSGAPAPSDGSGIGGRAREQSIMGAVDKAAGGT